MNFITYLYENIEKVGVMNSDKTKVLDITEIETFKDFNTMISLIENWNTDFNQELKEIMNDDDMWNENAINFENVKLIAPIPRLNRDVICLGLNYADHIAESQSAISIGSNLPEYPVYFPKMSSKVTGHQENINSHPHVTNELDYEVELAIIIGKDGTNIKPENVEDYIFGYTILNDVSAREVQRNHNQWFKGKSLDTFTVIGPWIVSKEEIPFPVELDISSKVNGQLRQNSNTKHFIFDIPHVISELSKGMTLKAGDVIATGTPAGVGMGFNPPKYLKAGDIVECHIEKIGSLINPIV